MFSKLMDKTRKGRGACPKRTICEVHRDIYDILVIELATTRPEVIAKIVPLLEEAFIMGVKLNKALVEHKLASQDDTAGPTDMANVKTIRSQRLRLIKLLEQNNQILTEYDKPNPKETT